MIWLSPPPPGLPPTVLQTTAMHDTDHPTPPKGCVANARNTKASKQLNDYALPPPCYLFPLFFLCLCFLFVLMRQTSETSELLREKYAKQLLLSEGRQLQVR